MASAQVATIAKGQVYFLAAILPTLRLGAVLQPDQHPDCRALTPAEPKAMNDAQRSVMATALSSVGCLDAAAMILPPAGTVINRQQFIAFQTGRIHWLQGKTTEAIAEWQQVPDIDKWLLVQARASLPTNVDEAAQWYEAAIRSSQSLSAFAETVTAYREESRGRMSAVTFAERLQELESHFTSGSAPRDRLSGLRYLVKGDYVAADKDLQNAIDLGMSDAETWYLLGDAAWQLGDLTRTEQAYRAALSAPVQIAWRRPWHLNRLASLLASMGRPNEALLFQEEAVSFSNYYMYSDNLAVLYAQLGEIEEAHSFCARARVLAGASQPALSCEAP